MTRREKNRKAICGALLAMDDEGFDFVTVAVLLPWTKTAGGFRDKVLIAELRRLIETRITISRRR